MTLINHRYRIIKALAEGGFGKTFLVEDTQMPSRRHCVIKQLKPMNDRPGVFKLVQERFAREAAVLEAVGKGHSQIPDLFAYFEEGGQFYLVQEWVEGKPLVDLATAPWPEEKVKPLLTSALEALAHVHSQNIIHRDIKPDNIILRDSDHLPCLIDFGAVKELMSTVVSHSGARESSITIGTPGFMPAEQAAGRPTFASDLYSMGMTAIYLLTARSPTQLPTDSKNGRILWQQYAPDVSTRFASILTRSIHPYFQTRYTTAADMLAALESPDTQIPDAQVSATQSFSELPTKAVAPMAPAPSNRGITTAPQTVLSASDSGVNRASADRSEKGALPWGRIGIAAGALLLGTGIVAGLQPRISLQSRTSDAEVVASSTEPLLDSADSEIAAAAAALEGGAYDEAIAQTNAKLQSEPNTAEALIVLGKSQFAKGDYTEAIETFTSAESAEVSEGSARSQPQVSAEALIERGDTYYEIGEYDKAVDDYRSALRLDPQNGRAYKEWAAVNVVKGNTQEALQNLDLAVQNAPASISAYVNRGSRRSDLGDREGAKEDWEKAASIEAYTADEYASRGFAKSRLGKKRDAVNDYNQALILNPNHQRTLLNRAYNFYESGEKQQALGVLDKVLAINPNSTIALMLQGEIREYSNPSDIEGALVSYDKALSVNPNDPDILNNRCTAHFSTQDFETALQDCDRGLSINPRSASLYTNRGNIYLQQDRIQEAIQDYSRTIELSEEKNDTRRLASAYSNRASALMQIPDPEGALSDINKSLEIDPEDPADLYKRGLVKVALDDRDGGRTDLRKAADLYVKAGRTESHQNVLNMMEQLNL